MVTSFPILAPNSFKKKTLILLKKKILDLINAAFTQSHNKRFAAPALGEYHELLYLERSVLVMFVISDPKVDNDYQNEVNDTIENIVMVYLATKSGTFPV
jgi:hypothetical protein